MKFNVEFTRQAVICFIKLASQLLQSSKGAFAGNARGKNHDPLLDSSVIACDKIKQRKVFSENVGIWVERLQTSEKENNYNLDKYLNIDNLPEGTCF